MANIEALKYLESHEWIAVDGNKARIGISDHAQREISDVVFIELPTVGKEVVQKESCMVIESVKAAFDIYSPASGKVTQVNALLSDEPQLVNDSPFDGGWLFEIELSNPAELDNLMDHTTYEGFKTQAH